MYNLIQDIIGYSGATGSYYSTYVQISGAIIVLIVCFAMCFVLEFLSSLFHK